MYGLIQKKGSEASESLDMQKLIGAFNNLWIPFRFSAKLPDDKNKLLVIAGRQTEQLTLEDRGKLFLRNTICFDRAGLTDERYNKTEPWFLKVVGLNPADYQKKVVHVNLFKGTDTEQQGSFMPSQKIISVPDSEVTFIFPGKNKDGLKSVFCSGQSIDVPANAYTSVDFLAASSKGNLARKVVLNYADGTSESRYLGASINDMRYKPYMGKIGWSGKPDAESDKIYLSHVSVACSPAKTLTSIALPGEPNLNIYAVSLVEGGLAENVEVTVKLGDEEISGNTDWVISVRSFSEEELEKAPFEVLARFSSGRPAVLKSKDGKHISFLYDALGWSYNETEISREINAHTKLLNSLLKDFSEQSGGKK